MYSSSQYVPGELIVKPICAKIYRNTQLFGKMDPFLEFQFQEQIQKTTVIHSGHKNPRWTDETLTFQRTNKFMLFVKLWDHERFKNHDLIGSNEFDISGLFSNNFSQKEFELEYDGQKAATLFLELAFKRTQPEQAPRTSQPSVIPYRNRSSQQIYSNPSISIGSIPSGNELNNNNNYQRRYTKEQMDDMLA